MGASTKAGSSSNVNDNESLLCTYTATLLDLLNTHLGLSVLCNWDLAPFSNLIDNTRCGMI